MVAVAVAVAAVLQALRPFHAAPHDVGTITHMPLRRHDNVTVGGAAGFRAILSHLLLSGAALLAAAQRGKWRLSWLGVSGSACGATVPNRTG